MKHTLAGVSTHSVASTATIQGLPVSSFTVTQKDILTPYSSDPDEAEGPWPRGLRATKSIPQIVHLAGELDSGNAILGLKELKTHLDDGTGILYLDMSAVEFIDASWLGILAVSAKRALTNGRRIAVVWPAPIVTRLLKLVGMNSLLESGPTALN